MHWYQQRLNDEFQERCSKNKRYSLRAFARDLKIAPSSLSETMSGKGGFSERAALRIAEELNLNAKEKGLFVSSVVTAHSRSEQKRAFAKSEFQSLSTYQYDSRVEVFSSWLTSAILEAPNLKHYQPTRTWLKEQFKISGEVLDRALAVLNTCGLVQFKEGGRIEISTINNFVNPKGPSPIMRAAHKQILGLSLKSVAEGNAQTRETCFSIFSTSKEDFEKKKKRVLEFIQSMSEDMNKTENAEEIYCLSVNLFPLTKDKSLH